MWNFKHKTINITQPFCLLLLSWFWLGPFKFSNSLGHILRRDLSLASYHFVLDLSPKADLSLFVKLAPVTEWNLHMFILLLQWIFLYNWCFYCTMACQEAWGKSNYKVFELFFYLASSGLSCVIISKLQD